MQAGGVHIGVRADSEALGVALRSALAANVVDTVEAPANYSVRLGAAPDDFSFLYWGGTTAVRTLDARRLLGALFRHVFAHGDPPPGILRGTGLVVEREGQVLVAPPSLRNDLARLEPLLARRGFAVLDDPWAEIDVATGELVVRELPHSVSWAPLDAVLAARPARRRAPREVAPGRYPVRAWAFSEPGAAPTGLAPADAVLRLAARARPLAVAGAVGPLGPLVSLVDRVPAYGLWSETAREAADGLEALFRIAAEGVAAGGSG